MTDQTSTTTTPDHDNTTLQQHATAIIQTAAKDVGGVYIRNHFGPDGHQPPESDVQHIAALISTARVSVDWPGSTTQTRQCTALCSDIELDRDRLFNRATEMEQLLDKAKADRKADADDLATLTRVNGQQTNEIDQLRVERDWLLAEADNSTRVRYHHARTGDPGTKLIDRYDRRLLNSNKQIIAENSTLRAERGQALVRVRELEQLRDRLTATVAAADTERDQLAKTLAEILHPDVMTAIGDGYRTNWTPRETVQRWRSALTAAGLGSSPRAQDAEQAGQALVGALRSVYTREQLVTLHAGLVEHLDPDHETVLGSLVDALFLAVHPRLGAPRAQEPVVAVHGLAPDAPATLVAAIGGLVDAIRRDLAPALAHFAPQPEPAAVDLDELMTSAQIRIQAATNDDERTEIVEDVLSGWYASWPDSAVTDPHWPIARELVRLLTPPRRQTDDDLAAIVTQALLPWSTGPYGDLALPAARAAGIAVTALADAWAFGPGAWCVQCGTALPRANGAGEPAQCHTCWQADPAGAMARVLVEIATERARQDAKFGQQDCPDGTGPEVVWAYTGPAAHVAETARAECQRLAQEGHETFRDIALEEVAEAFAESDPARLRAELVQVAAVAVKWVEAIDRRIASQPEPARGIAAVPTGGSVSGCYRCQLGDPHEVHQTAAEEFGQVPPPVPAATVVPGYHWGRAWDPSDIEAGCPCAKAPCGYVIQGQESEECDQHYGGRKTMRGGHLAERCPGAQS